MKRYLPLSLMLYVGISTAAEVSPYMAVDYGFQTKFHGEAFGINGGININDLFDINLGYNKYSKINNGKTIVNVKTDSFESSLGYTFLNYRQLSLYSRLGVAYTNERREYGDTKQKGYGFSPLFELGGQYHLTDKIDLYSVYKYIDKIGNSNIKTYDNYIVSFGVRYNFGKKDKIKSSEFINKINLDNQVIEKVKKENLVPIESSIYFDFDSVNIKNPEELDKLYNKITDKSTLISINGYTDNTGSDRYNYMLSEKRANKIKNIFKSIGYSNFDVEWFGEENPKYNNNSIMSRQLNRRVDILITR